MNASDAPRARKLDSVSQGLEDAILEFIHDAPPGFERQAATRAQCFELSPEQAQRLDDRFERLALALFVHQYERVPVYRSWCRSAGKTPDVVTRARDVPALPVEALRLTRVATFPEAHECAAFETSGTTSVQPGVLHLDSLALYDAALTRGFVHHVLPDRERIAMLSLIPDVDTAPRSSLSYMAYRVRQRYGTSTSHVGLRDARLDWDAVRRVLEAHAAAAEALCVLGTAFAHVQLLDACAEHAWSVELAPGSRLFVTGGYKGRTRELSPETLRQGLEQRLGIPRTHVVSEYGMTELGSQYYTLSLRQHLLGRGNAHVGEAWSAPFWMRTGIVESATGRVRPPSESKAPGLLAHHDLANRGSVAHLLCADVGAPRAASFHLQGRAPRADLRGCGLVAETALDGEREGA